uniref:NAC domain-containing protein n=1 Tax=Tanacetum cinerariifolium TaxID=118510 RepID=A0A6L2JFK6_TANCI|nr:NAC domain-containing protein [Tanacetum cinerariifolium]
MSSDKQEPHNYQLLNNHHQPSLPAISNHHLHGFTTLHLPQTPSPSSSPSTITTESSTTPKSFIVVAIGHPHARTKSHKRIRRAISDAVEYHHQKPPQKTRTPHPCVSSSLVATPESSIEKRRARGLCRSGAAKERGFKIYFELFVWYKRLKIKQNGDLRLRFADVYAFFKIKPKSFIFSEHAIGKSTRFQVRRNNNLTVVRSVEVPIIALIVKPGTSLSMSLIQTNSPVGEPEGSNDFTEVPFDDEQIIRQYNTAHVTPPLLAYTPTPTILATIETLDTFLMGDEVISTIPERENDEFIKSSVDDLVPIPRESELILDSTDLECSMLIDPPLPCTYVLGDAIGHRRTRQLLADEPVQVPRVFDEPLGNSDSVPRSYDVTFSNSLFDFNDDYTLCYDNLLFDKDLKDISSLDPPESTPVIDESTLLLAPLPDPKKICLTKVE